MRQPAFRDPAPPERDVDRLARRLNRHRLWNRLLAVVPPLALLAYAVTMLLVSGWVGFGVWLFSGAAILGVGAAILFHLRADVTTREEAARLLDERTGGKEHFLTLTHLPRLGAAPWVINRLRRESSNLLRRVSFRHDFPYRLRRASALSLVLSVLAVVLVHLFLESPVLSVTEKSALAKVQGMAKRLSRESGLEELAMVAQRAAGDLRTKIRNTPMVQQVMEQLESQLGGTQDGKGEGRGGGGSSERKSQRTQGDGQQENGPGSAQGDGDGEGASGDTPGDAQDRMANLSSGQQGERRPSDEGSGNEQRNGSGGTGEQEQDPGSSAKNDQGPTEQGKREGGQAGSGKSDESIPKGEEPDRFHPPGEGEGRIEGGRFVTVALPKTLARGGEEAPGEESGGRARASVPVGNIPLPPRDDPKAESEKQHMPAEYERLIN